MTLLWILLITAIVAPILTLKLGMILATFGVSVAILNVLNDILPRHSTSLQLASIAVVVIWLASTLKIVFKD